MEYEKLFTELTLFPMPVVVVSSGTLESPSLSTYIWVSQFNEDPLILAVGMKPKRTTYKVLKELKEFAVNIPDEKLLEKVDLIGTSSSSSENKIKNYDLIMEKGEEIDTIVWKECPVIYECKFIDEIPFKDHTMVIGEVVNVQARKDVTEGVTVVQELSRPLIASYTERNYYSLGHKLKPWGFTRYKKK